MRGLGTAVRDFVGERSDSLPAGVFHNCGMLQEGLLVFPCVNHPHRISGTHLLIMGWFDGIFYFNTMALLLQRNYVV